MAIMERVSDVTAPTPSSDLGVEAVQATVSCRDCGMTAVGSIAPMSWGFSLEGGRPGHTCPECVRASLDEIETFIRR